LCATATARIRRERGRGVGDLGFDVYQAVYMGMAG